MNQDGAASNGRAILAVRTLGTDLFKYVLRRVGNAQDAQDVTSTVFAVMWERRDRLPAGERDLRMWCFGIARNKVREHLRTVSRRPSQDTLDDHPELRARGTNPADVVAREDEAVRVRRALASLDSVSQELIILVHWDSLSLADASRLLRLKESSARTKYARAKARLAAVLGFGDVGLLETVPLPATAQRTGVVPGSRERHLGVPN